MRNLLSANIIEVSQTGPDNVKIETQFDKDFDLHREMQKQTARATLR